MSTVYININDLRTIGVVTTCNTTHPCRMFFKEMYPKIGTGTKTMSAKDMLKCLKYKNSERERVRDRDGIKKLQISLEEKG